MELRKWVYEDIYAIAALEKQCFADAWTFRMLADSFFSENTITVAAAEGDAIVGYGFLVVAGEEADLAVGSVILQYKRQISARTRRSSPPDRRHYHSPVSVWLR